MNELKYQITQFIFLALLGLGAYWALTHLDNGISYSRDQIVQREEDNGSDIDTPIIEDIPEMVVSEETNAISPEETETPKETETPSATLSASETEMVKSLQQLINDKIYMKVGSRGTRVGTVQKFLAYYFTDKKVSTDNDYGPGTKTLVEQFQSAQGLSADGQAGPSTYEKMIEVINK